MKWQLLEWRWQLPQFLLELSHRLCHLQMDQGWHEDPR